MQVQELTSFVEEVRPRLDARRSGAVDKTAKICLIAWTGCHFNWAMGDAVGTVWSAFAGEMTMTNRDSGPPRPALS
eukprot:7094991-Prymnesium_polylepis.2